MASKTAKNKDDGVRQPTSIYMYPSDEGIHEEEGDQGGGGEEGQEYMYYDDPGFILSGLFTPPSNDNNDNDNDNDNDGLRLEGEPCAFGPLSFGESSSMPLSSSNVKQPQPQHPKLRIRLPPREYTRSTTSDTHIINHGGNDEEDTGNTAALSLEPTLMSTPNQFFVASGVNNDPGQADDDLENLIQPPQDDKEDIESKSRCTTWRSASILCRFTCLIVLANIVGLAVMGTVCVTTDFCGIGGGDDDISTNDSEHMIDDAAFGNNHTVAETMSPTVAYTGTSSPTTTPTSNPTLVPSYFPTPAPTTSFSPTPAPTTWVQSLPDFSREALQIPMSIQSTAWIWMLKEYGITRLQELPAWRQSQIFAIACFYFSFDGAEQPGLIRNNVFFDTSLHECEWNTTHTTFGCTEEGQVATFSITTSPLEIVGVIPPEVILLESLNKLAVSNVNLIGNLTNVIPTQLALLESLWELELNDNQLFGTVPDHVGEVSQLKRLSLEHNRLTGTIPSRLFTMPDLIELNLSDNNFRGTIPAPPEPTTTTITTGSLQTLQVSNNSLTGTIPTELAYLRRLETLHLDSNQLTGPVPSEFGLMTNLRFLSFAGNSLQSISSELGLLTKLTQLHVGGGSLTGSADVPESICQLTLPGDDDEDQGPLQLTIGCETVDECPLDCKCSCFVAS